MPYAAAAYARGLGEAPIDARVAPYPSGSQGIALSLVEMGRLVRQVLTDPQRSQKILAWATQALASRGIDGRNRPSVQTVFTALLDSVRGTPDKPGATIWIPDPLMTEKIQAADITLCLRDDGVCIPGGDCLPEGTLLLKDDYSFVPIEQIRAGDRVWGHKRWSTVVATAFRGPKAIDLVHLNNGASVALSGNHKLFLNETDRVRVRDAEPGMTMLQPKRIAFGSRSMDPGRAYVEGLYLSDGWSERNRFSISGQDGHPKEAQKGEVKSICERLGIRTYWHRKHIRVLDSSWTRRMQEMGSRAPQKQALSIDLDEDTAKETLRGILADSGENTRGGTTFTTTSKKLFLQTRTLLRMFGRSASQRYIEDHGGLGSHAIWRLGIRDPRQKAEKQLRIKVVDREVETRPCYDLQTDDNYVYLPEYDVTVSNCDDLIVLMVTLLLSVGIAAQILEQDYGPGIQPHVLVAALEEDGEWLTGDPSSWDPVGFKPMAVSEIWVDPLKEAGPTGTPGPEILTLGAPPPRREGLGDVPGLPPGNWVPADATALQAGLRYCLIVGSKGGCYGSFGDVWTNANCIVSHAWTPDEATQVMSRDLAVESVTQVSPEVPTPDPFVTTWLVIGIAKHDTNYAPAKTMPNIYVASAWTEGSGTTPATPPDVATTGPNAPAGSPPPSTGIGILGTLGVAALGAAGIGLAWGVWRRRHPAPRARAA